MTATLTLTVCGSSGTCVGPGRACSSYLLSAGDRRVLLDCGNGSLANLQRRVAVDELDAVVVTHVHPDHFADLYSLYYALRFHPDGPRHVTVYAPRGTGPLIGHLLASDGSQSFADVCRFRDVAAGDRVEVGPLALRFFAANHPVETLAVRVEVGAVVLAYSADSHVTPELVACARDADLFVSDATWLERQRPLQPGIHMTGLEAGTTASEAGVGRLLVTHVFPTLDPAEVAAEASRAFSGPVLAARDLQELEL